MLEYDLIFVYHEIKGYVTDMPEAVLIHMPELQMKRRHRNVILQM